MSSGLCAAALLLLLVISRTPGHPLLLPKLLVLVGCCLLGATVVLFLATRHRTAPTQSPPVTSPGALTILLPGLILYVCSSATMDNWFFPSRWLGEKPILERPLQFGVLRCLLLMLPIAWCIRHPPRWRASWPVLWSILTVWILWQLYEVTGFKMIYRTDSPSFVYRFWSFAETFPRPGFYDPHWNAGMPVPYLVASGIWSIGLLLLPFLQWIPAEQLYTPTIAVLYLGCIPALAWLSLKWINASARARWIAALLALATTQRFWVHLLHYGTVSSLFSMTMAMPLAALWYRFLYLEPAPRRMTLALLLFLGLVMFAWPGSLIIALPFAVITLLHGRQLWPRKWIWMIAGTGLIAIILLPLALVPLRYSDLQSFNQMTAQASGMTHFKNGLGLFTSNLRSTNALLVIFGFIGAFWLPRRSSRWFFGPLILMLLVLAGWGEEVRKLLQSERIIVPAALVAILPTAWWLDHLLRQARHAYRQHTLAAAGLQIVTAWLLAILLFSVYQAGRTWGGKGMAPFQTRPAYMDEWIQWIKTEVPPDGRVLFAGRAVHAYGGGKVAALPLFTGREMMSSDFYGFSPKLVEYEYPPRIFRQDGPAGIAAFLEIYNITHILTWHNYWKEQFDREPDRYRRAHEIGRVTMYAVNRSSSLFWQGDGTVSAHFDEFRITLDQPRDPTVIKYHWAEGLVADPPVKVFPVEVGYDTRLIGFAPGTNQTLTLRYRP